jgi:hypothetical protein
LTLLFADIRRSEASDFAMSSDSLNFPAEARRTNRLSLVVSIRVRLAAFLLVPVFRRDVVVAMPSPKMQGVCLALASGQQATQLSSEHV